MGFGDILPLSLLETVVAVLIVLLGGLSYPAVISSILPLMSSLNAMAITSNFEGYLASLAAALYLLGGATDGMMRTLNEKARSMTPRIHLHAHAHV